MRFLLLFAFAVSGCATVHMETPAEPLYVVKRQDLDFGGTVLSITGRAGISLNDLFLIAGSYSSLVCGKLSRHPEFKLISEITENVPVKEPEIKGLRLKKHTIVVFVNCLEKEEN